MHAGQLTASKLARQLDGLRGELRTPYKDQGIGAGEAHHDLQVPALESDDDDGLCVVA